MRFLMFIAMACAMACGTARAYTPESGVWWNPNEPGTGWQFEIQDNFMAILGYTYDEDGFPLFVTAAGFMDSPTLFQSSTNNPTDGSWLNTYANGQCIGCAFTGYPDEFLGSEGRIVVQFDPLDQTRATLTWGGRSMPIERFHFYLKRAEDGAAPVETTKMLGEWTAVVDVIGETIQYYGDVLVFDDYYQEGGVWFFEGCRPETSIDNVCTEDAFEAHPVVGFYDTSTGFHQIVVVDYFDQLAGSDVCAVYDVQVGTNDFRGGWDGNFDFEDDGGAAYYYCPQPAGSTVPYNGAYDFYPIEGWRTASRTAVEEGEDVGPSQKASAKATKPRRGPAVSLRQDGAKTAASDALPPADRARLGELLRRAEAKLRD